jgi:two-component system KDP operon response regulator KdpE
MTMGATALNQFTMRLAAVGGDPSRSTGEARVHETGVNLIMLVDDDVHLRRAVARGLMAAGYKILEADCVRQAKQLADVQVADLFIIDLHLPDGHGSELVRHLKQRDPSLPVLVLSATIEQDERIEAFEAGADDVVG